MSSARSAVFSRNERIARGRTARFIVPRSAQAEVALPARRPDPVMLLERQARRRTPELVPLRYARMAESPFAFFRGAALVMASDLSQTVSSGLRAQLCGDAHLRNFGFFASPERRLVFDINDFDETMPGPWEWDVKRLLASIEVAGRELGLSSASRRDCVLGAAQAYREAMNRFAHERNLDVWYALTDADRFESERRTAPHDRRQRRKVIAAARERDSLKATDKLTEHVAESLRFVSRPPLVIPLRDLVRPVDRERFAEAIGDMLDRYRRTLDGPRRTLFEQYRFVDVAHKVVGVGSVGMRSWIALFVGVDDSDPLVLQIKEAGPSVLEGFVPHATRAHDGKRVVTGQRLMQAQSDILLGWFSGPGSRGRVRDYYVRQLYDWKGSVPLEEMSRSAIAAYSNACGRTLARTHARTGDRIAIAAYLGKGDRFDEAMVSFSRAYADQTERDHDALVRAIRAGRVSTRAPRRVAVRPLRRRRSRG